MLSLAIDTSAVTSVALQEHGTDGTSRTLAARHTEATNTQAEVLVSLVEEVLAEGGIQPSELDVMFVGVGPGPFTGLRVGIMAAHMLSFVWGKPLHGVMSLDAISYDVSHRADASREPFVVAIDARRKELYWAQYDAEGALLDGPHVSAPGELPAGITVFGAGASAQKEALSAAGISVSEEFAHHQPSAESLGAYGASVVERGGELLGLEPLYLRESDAKVPDAMTLNPRQPHTQAQPKTQEQGA